MSGNETVGRTLVTYICLFMVLGGIVFFNADRLGVWWRARQEHRRRPCRERATAHRSCGFADVTDSAIYLQHLAMSRYRRAQCGGWLAPVIAHASSLSP
jgi:hypothetical protein